MSTPNPGFIGCPAGDASSCAERIRRHVEAGAAHVALRFASGVRLTRLERLAVDVLPRVAGRATPRR